MKLRTIRRTFWPVGQGAFYTEVFFYKRWLRGLVVYDCGATGDQVPIIGTIKEVQRLYGHDIDVLFISHFHADHISQIPNLLQNFNIKIIVLPVISKEVVVDVYLNNYISATTTNSPVISLLEDLIGKGGNIGVTKIVRVNSTPGDKINGDGQQNFNAIDISQDFLDGLQADNDIESNTILRLYDWEYIICNYPCARSSKLIVEMQKRYPDLLAALLSQEWGDVRTLLGRIPFEDIEKLYKDCFSHDQNEESMVVLSRPVADDECRTKYCLYTGDSPFRNSKRLLYIKNYYKPHWDNIGTLQAPHHGADDDNPVDLHDSLRTCVVCYGTQNKYGHPGRQALLNMAGRRCNIRLVTENNNSGFSRYFNY